MTTPLESVERRRAQLQENVDKLEKALHHRSTWGLEYESLKEELQKAKDPSPSQMRTIGRNLGGSLLNENEIEELLGKDLRTKRNANQVIDMISRRIDYVQQNCTTVEKQLDSAQKQLAGTQVLLEPGMENEEGLPMMDIEEELDERGNELNSSVSQTGKNTAELLEVLRKAGIQKSELEGGGNANKSESKSKSTAPAPAPAVTQLPKDVQSAQPEATKIKPEAKRELSDTKPAVKKKSVAFAADTKPDPAAKPQKPRDKLKQFGYNDDIDNFNFTRGTKVIELNDDEDETEMASYPIIPQDETPEAATLRKQMLQYGLSEVGQIVAELDLDEPVAQYSDDEDEDDEEYDSAEESEEEDQFGRNLKPVITDDYKKQMQELEKKLNDRMMENVGPRPDTHPLAEHADDLRRLRVRKDDGFGETSSSDAAAVDVQVSSKSVRFADDVNVSKGKDENTAISTSTLSDTIVERSNNAPQPPAASFKPAKVSRFKSSRTSNQPGSSILPSPSVPEPAPMPTGPQGRTLANTVVEHAPSLSEPEAPDEFNPTVINREIQDEYHKMRNSFIQRQNGFTPTEEDQEDPIVEEKDGKPKKVSRFKAARLKAEGL